MRDGRLRKYLIRFGKTMEQIPGGSQKRKAKIKDGELWTILMQTRKRYRISPESREVRSAKNCKVNAPAPAPPLLPEQGEGGARCL